MAPTMPQAGQDFQINSRLVPPNPSEAHTHHSNRGQTASLVICQRPQSICSSLSSVVASNQAVQRLTFLPQSSTFSWKVFFSNLWPHPPGPLTTQAMGPSPCCSLSPSPGPWITLHTYISEHCDNAALSKFTKIIGHCLEQLWQQQVLFPCVNNFSNLKQCNWSQTICCPSGETWLVGKVGNPGNHFLRHTVGVQPELPPPTLTYTKTQAHTFTRSIQLLCQVFSAVCLLK